MAIAVDIGWRRDRPVLRWNRSAAHRSEHRRRSIEALLPARGSRRWTRHVEVPVVQPARGVNTNLVLERRRDVDLLVAAEAHSRAPTPGAGTTSVSRRTTAGYLLGSSTLVRRTEDRCPTSTGPTPHRFDSTVTARPEPASSRQRSGRVPGSAAVGRRGRAIEGRSWPGPVASGFRIDGDDVRLLDGPPRGVSLGR